MKKIGRFFAEYRWESLFFVIIFVMLFAGITKYPFLDVDTYQWMEKSFEIYRNNNWLTYTPWFGKPPLVIWITALSFKIFGVSLFSMRVMHQIMSFLLVLFVYLLGREMYGRKTGLWSAVIFAACPLFLFLVFSYKTDIPLAMFMVMAFYFYYLFRRTQRPVNIYLIYACCTAGLMMKSIYAFYPLVLIPFVAWMTGDKELFAIIRRTLWHHLAAIFLCAAAAAPWLIGQYLVYGNKFIGDLGIEMGGRLLFKGGSVGARDNDIIAYPRDAILFSLPWSIFIVPMAVSAWKKAKSSFDQLLLILWFFVPLIVFSFSGDLKAIRYLTFAFPALAILFASYFDGMRETVKLKYWVITASLMFSAVFVALVVVASRSPDPFARGLIEFMGPFLLIFSAVLLISAVVYIFDSRKSLILLAVGTLASLSVLLIMSFSYLGIYYRSNAVCDEVSRHIPANRKVIVYDMHFREYMSISRQWVPLEEYRKRRIKKGDIIMSSDEIMVVTKAAGKRLQMVFRKDSRNKGGRDVYRYRLYKVL